MFSLLQIPRHLFYGQTCIFLYNFNHFLHPLICKNSSQPSISAFFSASNLKQLSNVKEQQRKESEEENPRKKSEILNI